VVPTEAMEPAYSPGDRIVVDLDAYDAALPELGDAVVLHPPRSIDRNEECGVLRPRRSPCPVPSPGLSRALILKRVVALPGSLFSVRQGLPIVNGAPVLTDLIQRCRYIACNLTRTITIGPDLYFMMGDNSGASDDSRYWGPVPSRAIVGR